MALTPNSLAMGSFQPASTLSSSLSAPLTFYGLLDNGAGAATSYASGDLLIIEAPPLGTLDEAAADAAATTIIGILSKVGPRRQDQTPLTSGTAPAAALPNQRTTPATADGQNYATMNDPDFGVHYHLLLPGSLFLAHICDETDAGGTPGADFRADSDVDIYQAFGNTITSLTGGADEVRYLTAAGIHLLARSGSIGGAWARSLAYASPQYTTAPGGVFSAQPGPLIENDASTGTFNPVVVWTPTNSVLFG